MIEIDHTATFLSKVAIYNIIMIYGILYTLTIMERIIFKEAKNEVHWMKNWVDKRLEWLKCEFDKI